LRPTQTAHDRPSGLLAVEIGQPVGIGLVGPGKPKFLHAITNGGIVDQRRGLIPSPTRLDGNLCLQQVGCRNS
jgi:hypothetical protein